MSIKNVCKSSLVGERRHVQDNITYDNNTYDNITYEFIVTYRAVPHMSFAQSAGAVEYTDCTSAEG